MSFKKILSLGAFSFYAFQPFFLNGAWASPLDQTTGSILTCLEAMGGGVSADGNYGEIEPNDPYAPEMPDPNPPAPTPTRRPEVGEEQLEIVPVVPETTERGPEIVPPPAPPYSPEVWRRGVPGWGPRTPGQG